MASISARRIAYPGLTGRCWITGDTVLVEASRTDAFWGAGKMGTVKNMLGCLPPGNAPVDATECNAAVWATPYRGRHERRRGRQSPDKNNTKTPCRMASVPRREARRIMPFGRWTAASAACLLHFLCSPMFAQSPKPAFEMLYWDLVGEVFAPKGTSANAKTQVCTTSQLQTGRVHRGACHQDARRL